MNPCRGFTLAEVLITLGIIGIVAAMTLPTLMQSHREKQIVTQLKKLNSVLSNAMLMAYNEHGRLEDWGVAQNDNSSEASSNETKNMFINNLKPYLKTMRFCEFGNSSCETNPYKIYSLDGTAHTLSGVKFMPHLVLADGTSIIHLWFTGLEYTSKYGEIYVDLNGPKAPNKIGEDIFIFGVNSDKVFPYGLNKAGYQSQFKFDSFCSKTLKSRMNGYGCAAWVIYNENMEYLKCSGLSLDGKKKCK